MNQYEFNQLQNKEFLELAYKIKLALGAFLLLAIVDAWTLVASIKALNLFQALIGIVTVLATFYTVTALWRARGGIDQDRENRRRGFVFAVQGDPIS